MLRWTGVAVVPALAVVAAAAAQPHALTLEAGLTKLGPTQAKPCSLGSSSNSIRTQG